MNDDKIVNKGEIHKTPAELHSENASNVSVHPTPEEFKKRKTRTEKSNDYRQLIVVVKLRFQIVFCSHENEKTAFSYFPVLKDVSKSSFFLTE